MKPAHAATSHRGTSVPRPRGIYWCSVPRRRSQRGFALLLVFLMAAAVAFSLYREIPRVAFESARNKEQLLIDRGNQYKRAIQVYYAVNKKYPAKLEDLEKDGERRFLRRRYKDPMTGSDEWRLIHTNGSFLTDSLVKKPPAQNAANGLPGNQPVGAGPLGANSMNTAGANPGQVSAPGNALGLFGQAASSQPGQQSNQGQFSSQPNDPNQPAPVNTAVNRRPSDRGVIAPQPGQSNPNLQGVSQDFNQIGAGLPNYNPSTFNPSDPSTWPPITLAPQPSAAQNGQRVVTQQQLQQQGSQPGQQILPGFGGVQPNQPNLNGPGQQPVPVFNNPLNSNPLGGSPLGGPLSNAPAVQQGTLQFDQQVFNQQLGVASPAPQQVNPDTQFNNNPNPQQSNVNQQFNPPFPVQNPFGASPQSIPGQGAGFGGQNPQVNPFNPQSSLFGQPTPANPPQAPAAPAANPQNTNNPAANIGAQLFNPNAGGAAPGGNLGSPGIAGVASKFEGPSIMTYNKQSKYQEWEFVFDPSEGLPGQVPAQNPGLNPAQPGAQGSNGTAGTLGFNNPAGGMNAPDPAFFNNPMSQSGTGQQAPATGQPPAQTPTQPVDPLRSLFGGR